MISTSKPIRPILLHRRVKQRLERHLLPLSEVWSCLRDLSLQRHLERRGLRIKKLKGLDRLVFEARVDRDIRLIFTIQPSFLSSNPDLPPSPHEALVVWDIDHHDTALQRARRLAYLDLQCLDSLSLATFEHPDSTEAEASSPLDHLPLFAFAPISALAEPLDAAFHDLLHDKVSEDHLEALSSLAHVESLRDNQEFFSVEPFDATDDIQAWLSDHADPGLHLSPEEAAILQDDGPLLLQGSVGSGKTTVLLAHLLRRSLLQPSGRWLFLTYSPTLSDVCQTLLAQMPHAASVAKSIEIHDLPTLSRAIASHLGLPAPDLLPYDACKERFSAWYKRLFERWRSHLPSEVRPWAEVFPRPPWDEEVLWAEFWHRLRGGLDFQDKTPLTADGYLESRSEIPKEQRQAVFALYTEFFQEIQARDELSLAHTLFGALKHEPEGKPIYDGIYIDEAQDLCEIQWMLLLECLRSPRGLVMAGDPYQALRPSGFDWSRLQARIQEQIGRSGKSKTLEVPVLPYNLRNSRPICAFVSDVIDHLRQSWDLPSIPSYTPAAQFEGPPVALFSLDGLSIESAIRWLSPVGVVIVAEEAERSSPLLTPFRDAKIPILSVAESKGLDFDRVLLWGLWASTAKALKDPLTAGSPSLLRQIALSRLYVALTRARRGLCLVEPPSSLAAWEMPSWRASSLPQAAWWALWEEAERLSTVASLAMYRGLHQGNEASEEALRFYQETGQILEAAASLEAQGRSSEAAHLYQLQQEWEAAARCLKKAGEIHRLLDLWQACKKEAEAREDWGLVARALEEMRDFSDAAEAYQKAKKPGEAARCLERERKFAEAFPLYQEAGALEKAATCAARAGKHLEAASLYERLSRWSEAARLYLEAKEKDPLKAASCFERLGYWKEAAVLYESKGERGHAARCYEKSDQWASAARCYKLAGETEQAALCFEKAKELEQAWIAYKDQDKNEDAARCLESLGRFEEAAALYKQAGKLEEAAVCYECSDRWDDALALYEILGRWANIAPIYEEQKKYRKAAEIYATKLSEPFRAGLLYLRDHQHRKAAEAFESGGFWEDAALSYLKVKAYAEAARCYEACQMWKEAAFSWCSAKKIADSGRCFERFGDLRQALRCYLSEKAWEKAAQTLEKLGQFKEAAKRYLAADKREEAARSYERAGEWKEAADLWKKLKRWADAARSYMKGERLASAAEAFEEAGDIAQAASLYEGLLLWDKAGALYEKLERRADALRCYEKAHRYEKIADLYDGSGDRLLAANALRLSNPAKAAAIYQDLGRLEEAADAFSEAKEYLAAADLYKRLHRLHEAALAYARGRAYHEALDLYLALEAFEDAAACCLEIEDLPQASALYERLGRLEDAALCALQAGDLERAAALAQGLGSPERITSLLIQDGDFAKAAYLFLALGQKEEAAAAYRHAGLFDEAAHLYEEIEAWESLAHVYQEAGDLPKAAVLLEKLGQTDKAIAFYQAAGDTFHAARLYREAGRLEEAARVYLAADQKEEAAYWFLRAGRKDEAARLYRDLGQISKAAELFDEAGAASDAARLYRSLGQISKAASCLEAHHAFLEAAALWVDLSSFLEAARCFQAAQAWRQAANCYQWACAWSEAAACFEADGSLDEAAFFRQKQAHARRT